MATTPSPISDELRDSFAEELARLFHYYRELLAPDFGFHSSEGTVAWEQIMPNQRRLMAATARLVLLHLAANQYKPAPANHDAGAEHQSQ